MQLKVGRFLGRNPARDRSARFRFSRVWYRDFNVRDGVFVHRDLATNGREVRRRRSRSGGSLGLLQMERGMRGVHHHSSSVNTVIDFEKDGAEVISISLRKKRAELRHRRCELSLGGGEASRDIRVFCHEDITQNRE